MNIIFGRTYKKNGSNSIINTQEQYDNDDEQYAKFIRFLKENNVFLPWKERVMKRNNLEPSFNIKNG